MEITAKELRGKPSLVIEQAIRGTEIIITVRGKKMAKLIPYKLENPQKSNEDDLFGLWKDRGDTESVDHYVRSKRKGRSF